MLPNRLKKRMRLGAKGTFLKLHETASRFGVFVLPVHYYTPFPNLRELKRTRNSWARRSAMRGIDVDLEAQIRFLDAVVGPFEAEYRGNGAYNSAVAGACGPGFGYIEAQALHGFIRGTKPRRIIEIGSGVSTYCMLEALGRNAAEGSPATITCVEPHPSDWLRRAPVRLIQQKVEDVDLRLFSELRRGDFLFVDSTHTVRVGGDVMRIILEIMPLLEDGVSVHFHDIYLPYDFQRDADSSMFQWMETALLHAYLINNNRISVLFCLSQMHYDGPDALKRVFPEYVPEEGEDGLRLGLGTQPRHFPSSTYLQVGGSRAPLQLRQAGPDEDASALEGRDAGPALSR